MFNEKLKKKIAEIWRLHSEGFQTEDALITPNHIDDRRMEAVEIVRLIISNFVQGDFNVQEFKAALDSYNKHNNLWGFTAKLGQMFFNQLIKAHESNPEKLAKLLREIVTEPKSLREALSRIDSLEKLSNGIYRKSKDKHNAPYPGATGFFLTYFWQIHNPKKWPILYNSLLNAFKELGVWEDKRTQKETYELYYRVYNEIKDTVEDSISRTVSFWELEHAFWNYKSKPEYEVVRRPEAEKKQAQEPEPKQTIAAEVQPVIQEKKPEIQVSTEPLTLEDYIVPRFLKIQESVTDTQESELKELVCDIFRQLDFQCSNIEEHELSVATALLKHREENIAFVLDVYSTTAHYFDKDRRAVKEYINEHCDELRKKGYKKVAYILVCKEMGDVNEKFIHYLQWHTDLRKISLIQTDLLLEMLAYKFKNQVDLMHMIEKISRFPQVAIKGQIKIENC